MPGHGGASSEGAPRASRRAAAARGFERSEPRCLLAVTINEFPVPTPGAAPNAITAGPDGNLWFTDGGANQIAMINPTTHAVTGFPIPTPNSYPSAITVGPDGNLWFTESNATRSGRLTRRRTPSPSFPSPRPAPIPMRSRPGPMATSGSPRAVPTRSG